MKKSILSLLILLSTTSGVMAQDNTSAAELDAKYTQGLIATGNMAPDFVIKKAKEGKEGLSLSDYRTHTEGNLLRPGCWVVLDFWATWCPDCRKEIPTVKELYKKYNNKVKLIGVSFDTDKEKLKEFRESNGIKWTMFSEYKKWKETKISGLYNIQWLPTMYLIDPEGKVAYTTVVAENMMNKLAELDQAGKLTEYIKKAEFPGGKKAYAQAIKNIIKYPEALKKYNAAASIKLSFIVDEDGNAHDITVKEYNEKTLSGTAFNQLSPQEQENVKIQAKTLFSQEAIRALTQLTEQIKWIPGEERGKRVPVKFSQTVNFKW